MPRLPFLLTRLDSDIPDVNDVSARLRQHLMRLRGHEIGESDLEAFHHAMDAITDDEIARLPTTLASVKANSPAMGARRILGMGFLLFGSAGPPLAVRMSTHVDFRYPWRKRLPKSTGVGKFGP